jgi:copper chaperone CopZ
MHFKFQKILINRIENNKSLKKTIKMYKMKKTGLTFMALLLSFIISHAQIKNAKTDTVKVSGNCDMCKNTIEKAGNKKKTSKVVWNTDTKLAIVTYDTKKTNTDAILKRIALSGYDNEIYLAPDNVYASLHGCCKYERKQSKTVKSETKNQTEVNTGTQVTNQLAKVFSNYFSLKDALVSTDGNLASQKASELVKSINEIKMDKLTTEEHNVWMKVMKDLVFDAAHINETKEASHQRDHFVTLSKNIYELIKVSKQPDTIYYQHCPMYNDGKGANWLSKESAIKNPYYGSQMLSCGKTVETIK